MNPSAARRGEIRTMPYTWPEDTDFALWELDVVERQCPSCGRMMPVCDHRYRRFHTLQGPVELLCSVFGSTLNSMVAWESGNNTLILLSAHLAANFREFQ